MRIAAALLIVLTVATTPACQMNERLSGTIFGGVGGAVIGGVASGAGGVVVGGLAGALVGYLVGDYLADQRERGRASVWGSEGQVQGIRYDEPAHVLQARAAYEKGRAARTAPEAKRWYEESLRLNPQRPEPYNMLGLNALAAQDMRGAEQYFRRALEIDPAYGPARHNHDRLRRQRVAR